MLHVYVFVCCLFVVRFRWIKLESTPGQTDKYIFTTGESAPHSIHLFFSNSSTSSLKVLLQNIAPFAFSLVRVGVQYELFGVS